MVMKYKGGQRQGMIQTLQGLKVMTVRKKKKIKKKSTGLFRGGKGKKRQLKDPTNLLVPKLHISQDRVLFLIIGPLKILML